MHDATWIAVRDTALNLCAAATLIAPCGCTDPGVVGVVCEAGACEDAALPADAEPDPAACRARYADCVLLRLSSFTYDVCVPDALACGAISEQEAVERVCSARLGACLEARPQEAAQCQLESEQCSAMPWSELSAAVADDA